MNMVVQLDEFCRTDISTGLQLYITCYNDETFKSMHETKWLGS